MMPHELLPRFFTAVFNGDIAEVRRLVIEAPSLTSERDKGKIVRSLIATDEYKEAIESNPCSVKKLTALDLAARQGNVDVIAVLLEAGAKPDAHNIYSWTPMHHAARQGHGDAIIALHKAGAKLDTPSNFYWTPMHFAAYSGRVDAIIALCEAGAKADTAAEYGVMPIHLGAYRGHVDVVATLADQGVAIDKTTITDLEHALGNCLNTLRTRGGRDLAKRNQAAIQAERLVRFGVKVPEPKTLLWGADSAEGFIKHLQGIATDALPLRETRGGLRMSLLAGDSLAGAGAGAGAGAMVSDVSDRGRMTVPPVRGK